MCNADSQCTGALFDRPKEKKQKKVNRKITFFDMNFQPILGWNLQGYDRIWHQQHNSRVFFRYLSFELREI